MISSRPRSAKCPTRAHAIGTMGEIETGTIGIGIESGLAITMAEILRVATGINTEEIIGSGTVIGKTEKEAAAALTLSSREGIITHLRVRPSEKETAKGLCHVSAQRTKLEGVVLDSALMTEEIEVWTEVAREPVVRTEIMVAAKTR